jgi:hypothetical protein
MMTSCKPGDTADALSAMAAIRDISLDETLHPLKRIKKIHEVVNIFSLILYQAAVEDAVADELGAAIAESALAEPKRMPKKLNDGSTSASSSAPASGLPPPPLNDGSISASSSTPASGLPPPPAFSMRPTSGLPPLPASSSTPASEPFPPLPPLPDDDQEDYLD